MENGEQYKDNSQQHKVEQDHCPLDKAIRLIVGFHRAKDLKKTIGFRLCYKYRLV
jgi:hypothetical protein